MGETENANDITKPKIVTGFLKDKELGIGLGI